MKKLIKPLAIIIGIIAILFIGAVIFVHLYLTDARIKSLIIPPAERVLGRKVAMGDISVGIFTGVTVTDFAIKEQDKKQDFAAIHKFILRYDLIKLLQKQIVIKRVQLDEPVINISRNKEGKFNFETLAILTEKEPPPKPAAAKKETQKKQGIPLALTVEEVRIDDCKIKISDAQGEIPDITIAADTKVSLAVSAENVITYAGDFGAKIDAVYGELKPDIALKGNFDQNNLDYRANFLIEGQKIAATGRVKDYAKKPDILLNVSSDMLDLDRLAALPEKLPKKNQAGTRAKHAKRTTAKTTSPQKTKQSASSVPPIHGKMLIKKAAYNKLTISDFSLDYVFKNNLLQVSPLSLAVADGKITGQTNLDLNQSDLKYKGKIEADSIQLGKFLDAFAPKVAKTVGGGLSTSMIFSGKGTEWEKMRNALNADGSFTIQNGRFQNTPMTAAIATLLDLGELNNLTFKESGGKFQVKDGRARLTSAISGSDVSASGDGIIGLDGALDFPVTLRFSPNLSAKLKKRASFAKYLADEKGETVLHLKVKGTVVKPRPTIDTKGLQKQAEEQVKKEVKKKAQKEIDRAIKKHLGKDTKNAPLEDAAQELLDKMFGK